jgi:hypothetical protein
MIVKCCLYRGRSILRRDLDSVGDTDCTAWRGRGRVFVTHARRRSTIIFLDMRNHSLIELLNAMAGIFHLGQPAQDEEALCDVFDATSEFPLSLIGEAREQFQSSVDDLLDCLGPVNDTLSRQFLIKELIPLIREKKITGQAFDAAGAERFRQHLSALPLEKYRVLRPLWGVDVAPEKAPITLGDFTIDFGRKVLIAERDSPVFTTVQKPEWQNQLLIQCSVPARESNRASELADKLFYRFELIFRFLIGRRTDWVDVGILNYKGARMRDQFLYSEDGSWLGHSSGWQGAMQPFLLKDERFPIPTPPMIELLTRSNNDLEKHIVRCAEWTGQAIAEPNEAAALVKAAIALEVLFSANEKGVITPSIMAQIAESSAFLLGTDSASSMGIEREVKRLYGVRSAVVHSGKDAVDPKDLNAFIRICRRLVLRLLSEEEFRQMDSVSRLAESFRQRKYAVSVNT